MPTLLSEQHSAKTLRLNWTQPGAADDRGWEFDNLQLLAALPSSKTNVLDLRSHFHMPEHWRRIKISISHFFARIAGEAHCGDPGLHSAFQPRFLGPLNSPLQLLQLTARLGNSCGLKF